MWCECVCVSGASVHTLVEGAVYFIAHWLLTHVICLPRGPSPPTTFCFLGCKGSGLPVFSYRLDLGVP